MSYNIKYEQITSSECYKRLKAGARVYVTPLKWRPDWYVEYAPIGYADSISEMLDILNMWIFPNMWDEPKMGKSIIYWKPVELDHNRIYCDDSGMPW